MDNHRFKSKISYKWIIFNSYVKVPEGSNKEDDLTWPAILDVPAMLI
jgi:hypothetical protein